MTGRTKGMRSGLIARKLGMTTLFLDGAATPVTMLYLDDCQVVSHRTPERDGYCAMQLGAGKKKPQNVPRPLLMHYAAHGVGCKRIVREFPVDPQHLVPEGSFMLASHLVVGQRVDVQGTSKGKGFAGAMKRWGFRGLEASHGVSVSHRSHGSTGNRQDPGKTFKGKKMAGHLGNKVVTIQNLTVEKVEPDKGLVFVKGCVPGPANGYVKVFDSRKSAPHPERPLPGSYISNRASLPWIHDQEPPHDVVGHVSYFREAWATLGKSSVNGQRARAAYGLYNLVYRLLASPGILAADDPQKPSLLLLLRNLPSAAWDMTTDIDRDVARAGALLLAVTQVGARPELSLSPEDDEWSGLMIRSVRAAVMEHIDRMSLKFVIRHDLRRRYKAHETFITGTIEIFDRIPALDLNGPIKTADASGRGKAGHLSATFDWTTGERQVEFKKTLRPVTLTAADLAQGLVGSMEVRLSTRECVTEGLLSVRPSMSKRPFSHAITTIGELPIG